MTEVRRYGRCLWLFPGTVHDGIVWGNPIGVRLRIGIRQDRIQGIQPETHARSDIETNRVKEFPLEEVRTGAVLAIADQLLAAVKS